MKKAILIVAALILVVSGVAAVSAYEAHTVNVKAHVENALSTPAELTMANGFSIFPEEWVTGDILIEASTSFKAQDRVTTIEYKVCAMPKTVLSPDGDDFIWAGGFTFVSVDNGANWVWIGPTFDEEPPQTTPPIICLNMAPGIVTSAQGATLMVGMDVPVFVNYWNAYTDVDDKPRPVDPQGLNDYDGDGSVMDSPCVISDGNPLGDWYGVELIIQVTDIR